MFSKSLNEDEFREAIEATANAPILFQSSRPRRLSFRRSVSSSAVSARSAIRQGASLDILNMNYPRLPALDTNTAFLGTTLITDFNVRELREERKLSLKENEGKKRKFSIKSSEGDDKDGFFGLDMQNDMYNTATKFRPAKLEKVVPKTNLIGNSSPPEEIENSLKEGKAKLSFEEKRDEVTDVYYKTRPKYANQKQTAVIPTQVSSSDFLNIPDEEPVNLTKPKKISIDGSSGKKRKKVKKKDPPITFDKVPENERHDEWLYYTGSDIDVEDDDPYDLHNQRKPQDRGKSESQLLLQEMSLYFKLLKWAGRMPFVTKKYKGVCRFIVNKRSCEYIIYCVTSFLMTLIAGTMLANIITIMNKNEASSERKIEELQLDKYWEIGVLTLANVFYVVVGSIHTIFSGSYHISEFLTRWNLCSNLMRYNTSAKLKFIIYRESIAFAVYSSILFGVMCFYTTFLDWNGSFGFIATLVFRSWVPGIRLSRYYQVWCWIGLIIHLYIFVSSRLMTNMVILYCRSLENAARWWNYRLVGVLGQVCKIGKDGKILIHKRMIPYTKLIAEHLVITSFSRQIGRAFAVILTAFMVTRGLSMLVTAYQVLLVGTGNFTSGQNAFEHSTVQGVNRDSAPITYQLSMGTLYFYLILMAVSSWSEFWYTIECIHNAGEVIMIGFDYIRRHGLMLCKSSKERRFVLTFLNMFNPKSNYYVTYGFPINRPFLFTFCAAILTYTLLLQGLGIQKLVDDDIFVCGDNGICMKLKQPKRGIGAGARPKDMKQHMTNSLIRQVEITLKNATTQVPKLEAPIKSVVDVTNVSTTNSPSTPPTVPTTPAPIDPYTEFISRQMYMCPYDGSGQGVLRFKYLFYGHKVVYDYYDDQLTHEELCKKNYPPFSEKRAIKNPELIDSFNNKVCILWMTPNTKNHHRDDCGNPWIPYVNPYGETIIKPEIELVEIIPDKSRPVKREFYCCWKLNPKNYCGLSFAHIQDVYERAKFIQTRCAKGHAEGRRPNKAKGKCAKIYAEKLDEMLPCNETAVLARIPPKITTIPPREFNRSNPIIKPVPVESNKGTPELGEKFESSYMYSCMLDGEKIYRPKTLFKSDNTTTDVEDFPGKTDAERCQGSDKPFIMANQIMYRDFSGKLTCISNRDDCYNPWMRFVDKSGAPVEPEIELVQINAGTMYKLCCWKWAGWNTKCGLSLQSGANVFARRMYLINRGCTHHSSNNNNLNDCIRRYSQRLKADGNCVT